MEVTLQLRTTSAAAFFVSKGTKPVKNNRDIKTNRILGFNFVIANNQIGTIIFLTELSPKEPARNFSPFPLKVGGCGAQSQELEYQKDTSCKGKPRFAPIRELFVANVDRIGITRPLQPTNPQRLTAPEPYTLPSHLSLALRKESSSECGCMPRRVRDVLLQCRLLE